MFNRSQLEGILLSHPKCEISVARDKETYIGYRVRLKVSFRGREEFLKGIQRTLLQHEIDSKFKSKEHKTRPRPILTITGKKNLWNLCNIIPDDLPTAKGEWVTFKQVVAIVDSNRQHTEQGLDEILELKGVI